MDAEFFEDSDWEDQILACLEHGLLDLDLLSSIVSRSKGRFSVTQPLSFKLEEISRYHSATLVILPLFIPH